MRDDVSPILCFLCKSKYSPYEILSMILYDKGDDKPYLYAVSKQDLYLCEECRLSNSQFCKFV